jgi:hypothetical protein
MLLKISACLVLLFLTFWCFPVGASMSSPSYRIQRDGVGSGISSAVSPAYANQATLAPLPTPETGLSSPNYRSSPLTPGQAALDQRDGVLDSANTSGVPQLGDALIVLKGAVGELVLTPGQLFHADVAPLKDGRPNPDGKVDLGDVLLILRRVVHLVSW